MDRRPRQPKICVNITGMDNYQLTDGRVGTVGALAQGCVVIIVVLKGKNSIVYFFVFEQEARCS